MNNLPHLNFLIKPSKDLIFLPWDFFLYFVHAGVLAENPLGYALFNTYFTPVLSKPNLTIARSMFQDSDCGLSGYQPDIVEAQAMLRSLNYERNIINQDTDIIDGFTFQNLDAPHTSGSLVQLEII